jgi:cardiolipin synthase
MTRLTVANQLTLLRMLLIPAFVILVVYHRPGWALTTFVVAGITDGLDGLIARRRNQQTSLGAWLDPMADKLLLVTTFVVLTVPGTDLVNRFPLWLTILVITRDVVIVTTVAIVTAVMGVRTFRPSMYGKIATGVYLLTCVVILWFNYLERPSVLVDTGVWTCLAITLVSGFHYIWHAARIINAPHGDRDKKQG